MVKRNGSAYVVLLFIAAIALSAHATKHKIPSLHADGGEPDVFETTRRQLLQVSKDIPGPVDEESLDLSTAELLSENGYPEEEPITEDLITDNVEDANEIILDEPDAEDLSIPLSEDALGSIDSELDQELISPSAESDNEATGLLDVVEAGIPATETAIDLDDDEVDEVDVMEESSNFAYESSAPSAEIAIESGEPIEEDDGAVSELDIEGDMIAKMPMAEEFDDIDSSGLDEIDSESTKEISTTPTDEENIDSLDNDFDNETVIIPEDEGNTPEDFDDLDEMSAPPVAEVVVEDADSVPVPEEDDEATELDLDDMPSIAIPSGEATDEETVDDLEEEEEGEMAAPPAVETKYDEDTSLIPAVEEDEEPIDLDLEDLPDAIPPAEEETGADEIPSPAVETIAKSSTPITEDSDVDDTLDTEVSELDDINLGPSFEPGFSTTNSATITLSFPADYDEVTGDEDVLAQFETTVVSSLATAAGVDEDDVAIDGIRRGSTIVQATIRLSEDRNPAEVEETLESTVDTLFGTDFLNEFGIPKVLPKGLSSVPTSEAGSDGPETEGALEDPFAPEGVSVPSGEGPVDEPGIEDDLVDLSSPLGEDDPTPETPIDDPGVEDDLIESLPPVVEDVPIEEPDIEDDLVDSIPPASEDVPIEEPDIEDDLVDSIPPVVEDLSSMPADEPDIEDDLIDLLPPMTEDVPIVQGPAEEPDIEEDLIGSLPPTVEDEVDTLPEISDSELDEPIDEESSIALPDVPMDETSGLDEVQIGPSLEPESDAAATKEVKVTLSFDADFGTVTGDPNARDQLETGVVSAVATAAGVSEDDVDIVDVREGSIIVETAVTVPEDTDPVGLQDALEAGADTLFGTDFLTEFGGPTVSTEELPSILEGDDASDSEVDVIDSFAPMGESSLSAEGPASEADIEDDLVDSMAPIAEDVPTMETPVDEPDFEEDVVDSLPPVVEVVPSAEGPTDESGIEGDLDPITFGEQPTEEPMADSEQMDDTLDEIEVPTDEVDSPIAEEDLVDEPSIITPGLEPVPEETAELEQDDLEGSLLPAVEPVDEELLKVAPLDEEFDDVSVTPAMEDEAIGPSVDLDTPQFISDLSVDTISPIEELAPGPIPDDDSVVGDVDSPTVEVVAPEVETTTLAPTSEALGETAIVPEDEFQEKSIPPTSEPAPATITVAVTMSFDQDFDEVIGNEEVRKKFEDGVIFSLAATAGVAEENVKIVDLQPGSIIVETEITLPAGQGPEEAAAVQETLQTTGPVLDPDFEDTFGQPTVTAASYTITAPVPPANEIDVQWPTTGTDIQGAQPLPTQTDDSVEPSPIDESESTEQPGAVSQATIGGDVGALDAESSAGQQILSLAVSVILPIIVVMVGARDQILF